MSAFDDALARLATKYNGNGYDASTNPGGMDNGGHTVNFIPSLRDTSTVGTNVSTLASTAVAAAGTAMDKATSATASAATATAKATEAAASAVAAAANVNPLWLYHGISPIGIQPTFQFRPGYEDVPSIISVVRASTATRVNEIGLIESVANNILRIDHDPVTGECLGALVEESRTNLLTYSDQFDNAAWVKTRSSISANVATSPDGTMTADMFTDGPAGDGISSHIIQQLVTVTNGTAYTYSVYVKAGTRNKIVLFFGGSYGALFDVSSGTVGTSSDGVTASIVSIGNGWFRCAVTYTVTTTSYYMNTYLCDASGSTAYTGDGTSGLYVWGAQLEAGEFPTSHIPTTTAATTRAADVVTVQVSAFPYNPLEGTLYANFNNIAFTNLNTALHLDNGTANESVGIRTAYGNMQNTIYAGSVLQANLGGAAPAMPSFYKDAFAWKLNDAAVYLNGTSAGTDTAMSLPTSMTTIRLGSHPIGAYVNGHIRHIAYFPKRLTNSNLQLLTA